MYKEDPRASIEELSAIFSTANFSSNIVDMDDSGTEIEKREDLAGDEDDDDLNIGMAEKRVCSKFTCTPARLPQQIVFTVYSIHSEL